MDKGFSIVDYTVFIGTLAISLLIGCYYAFVKTQKTTEELLVGNRNVGILPSCLSLVATYMSAILVLGFSGEIYNTGTLILEVIIGNVFFVPLSGLLFLPTLYRLKLTSVYEYLEHRFQSRAVRCIATLTFITQITLYMGVVLLAPAIALNAVVQFPIWMPIVCIGGCAALYTSIGGLKAVVWTDCFQILMMFAGMLAIIIKGSSNLGGLENVFKIAKEHGRIEFLNFTVDPFLRHSSLNIFFGQGIIWMSAYGCHQSTVQRYCSMSSLKKAFIALLLTTPILAFTMTLAGLTGLVVFSNYAGCDPIALGFVSRSDQISPYYVLDHLNSTIGMLGLFIACLFSGALSTISSAINSLAAVFWEDFVSKLSFFKSMSTNNKGLTTKFIGMLFGVIAIGMGFVSQNLGGVLSASIVVNGAVSGPLFGVFVLGILIPWTNKWGAIIGMLTSHVITFWISIGGLLLHRKIPTLPFSIDKCSNETLSKVHDLALVMAKLNSSSAINPPIEWPEKVYTISYMLYPLVGALVTIIVGVLVSFITGPSSLTEEQEPYIHPGLVYLKKAYNRKLMIQKNKEETEMAIQNPKKNVDYNQTKTFSGKTNLAYE